MHSILPKGNPFYKLKNVMVVTYIFKLTRWFHE